MGVRVCACEGLGDLRSGRVARSGDHWYLHISDGLIKARRMESSHRAWTLGCRGGTCNSWRGI
jgi:hypothetical protein